MSIMAKIILTFHLSIGYEKLCFEYDILEVKMGIKGLRFHRPSSSY